MVDTQEKSFHTLQFINKDKKFLPIELHHWASMGDDFLEEVKHILKLHPDYINEKNNKKDTALLLASRFYSPQIFKYLYDFKGVNQLLHNDEGNIIFNLLHSPILTKENHKKVFEILDFLYLKNPELFLECNSHGDNIFFIIALHGDDVLFSYVEDKIGKVKTKKLINHLNNNNESILFPLCARSISHCNYGLIDLIENYLTTKKALLTKNNQNLDIVAFTKIIENRAENVLQFEAYQSFFKFVKKLIPSKNI